jgi:hypothetical protein
MVIAAGYAFHSFRAAATQSERLPAVLLQTLGFAFGSVIVVLMLIFNLTFYAILLYPDLPKRLGGGTKPHVLVVLTEPHAVHSDLPISKDGRVIGPAALLLDAANGVAIIGYDDVGVEQQGVRYNVRAVSIERKYVSGLIYLKPLPPTEAK